MPNNSKIGEVSKLAKWAGRFISGVCALLLALDGFTKALQDPHVVQALTAAGYHPNVTVPLGITILVGTVLYLFPYTSILGAILLTGFLGGATDSMVRMGDSTHPFLIPVIFGMLVWLGLYLRVGQLQRVLPLRKEV